MLDRVDIPAIGFGTADMPEDRVEQAVLMALSCGCRFIDTAYVYKNEYAVGRAINKYISGGGVRNSLFVQTKFYPQMPYGYDEVISQFNESLRALQLDYVDAYLIHQPVPRYGELEYQSRNRDVWRAMEDLWYSRRVRIIGVSNFLERHILQIEENCRIRPTINQLEINPEFQQRGLAGWCRDKGMIVQSWGALRHGGLSEQCRKQLHQIAIDHNVSIAQVCIRWNMQMGNIPIFSSTNREHIATNIDASFELSEQEMETIRLCNTSTEHKKTWWYPRQQMY